MIKPMVSQNMIIPCYWILTKTSLAPSIPNDDTGMGANLDGEVYGLSNLRRSQRIAGCVKKIGQQRWRSNAPAHITSNREESDEEEEKDAEDDEPFSDFDVASDEGLEGYEDDDGMFAGPGQEGISLWDSLGEGFLREASQLGMLYHDFLKKSNSYESYSRGKASG